MILVLLIRRYIWLFLSIIAPNLNAQGIKFHRLTEENVFDKQPVLSIVQDSKGTLWFAGGNNIYSYNSERVVDMKFQDTSWNRIGYITKLRSEEHTSELQS